MSRSKRKKNNTNGKKSKNTILSNSSQRGSGRPENDGESKLSVIPVVNVEKKKSSTWQLEFESTYNQTLRNTKDSKIIETPFVGTDLQHKIILESRDDGQEIKIIYKDYQAIIGRPDLFIDLAMICGRSGSGNSYDMEEQMEDPDDSLNNKTLRSIWPISENGLKSAKELVKTLEDFRANRRLRSRDQAASIMGGTPSQDEEIILDVPLGYKIQALPRYKYAGLTIIYARLHKQTKEEQDLIKALTNLKQFFLSGTHNLAHLDKKHQAVLIQYASIIFSFARNYVESEADNITESMKNIISLMFGEHVAENKVPAAMAQHFARLPPLTLYISPRSQSFSQTIYVAPLTPHF